jgi:hypothetical protein
MEKISPRAWPPDLQPVTASPRRTDFVADYTGVLRHRRGRARQAGKLPTSTTTNYRHPHRAGSYYLAYLRKQALVPLRCAEIDFTLNKLARLFPIKTILLKAAATSTARPQSRAD